MIPVSCLFHYQHLLTSILHFRNHLKELHEHI